MAKVAGSATVTLTGSHREDSDALLKQLLAKACEDFARAGYRFSVDVEWTPEHEAEEVPAEAAAE